MKRSMSAALFLLVFAASTFAQTDESDATDTDSDTDSGQPTHASPAPAAAGGGKPYFEPSEEISEDLSVSFPIDI